MIDIYFNKVSDTLERIDKASIFELANIIRKCTGTIFVFGNGGSGATASHFAQDMNKQLDCRFICLNDNMASVLAYANDCGFDCIFKLQLAKLIQPGDIVIGISCSGNSKNVIDAIIYAKHYGYLTIGLTGYDGGQLRSLVEHSVHVPSMDMQICEDVHLIITHTIMKINIVSWQQEFIE
jgi:D-sedoheptulose 7-phosphate isomerase